MITKAGMSQLISPFFRSMRGGGFPPKPDLSGKTGGGGQFPDDDDDDDDEDEDKDEEEARQGGLLSGLCFG